MLRLQRPARVVLLAPQALLQWQAPLALLLAPLLHVLVLVLVLVLF